MDKRFRAGSESAGYGRKMQSRAGCKTTGGLSFVNFKSPQSAHSKKFLANRILFDLPEKDLEMLLPYAERVQLARNEYVCQPHEFIYSIYFPESAVISECQILEDGKMVEVAMVGKEGLLGISSLLNDSTARNWGQATIAGSALRVNAKIFREIFSRCAALQRIFFSYLDFYIGQISQRVICNSHHLIEERLCSWLLMIEERAGSGYVPLTQEDIARFLGVHRPSVTNIMQALREKQIIDYVRGNILILDREKLKNAACACYTILRMPS